MTCPEWSGLLAERERSERGGDLEPSTAWRTAIDHLRGCVSCRRTALDLDPSLLFVAQPALEVSAEQIGEIVASVRTLRRAREAERASAGPRRRVGRVAAVAAVVSLMILLPTHTSRQPVSTPVVLGPNLAADSMPPTARDLGFGDGPAPVIEPLNLPRARIYLLGEEDLPVVMVVDESIDV